MNWYDYIACFFAGMFLANVVPHFVHGISGDCFPTPFADPPGKVSSGDNLALLTFFAGIVAISTMSSVRFQTKQAK
jgi:hypothetical protein